MKGGFYQRKVKFLLMWAVLKVQNSFCVRINHKHKLICSWTWLMTWFALLDKMGHNRTFIGLPLFHVLYTNKLVNKRNKLNKLFHILVGFHNWSNVGIRNNSCRQKDEISTNETFAIDVTQTVSKWSAVIRNLKEHMYSHRRVHPERLLQICSYLASTMNTVNKHSINLVASQSWVCWTAEEEPAHNIITSMKVLWSLKFFKISNLLLVYRRWWEQIGSLMNRQSGRRQHYPLASTFSGTCLNNSWLSIKLNQMNKDIFENWKRKKNRLELSA